MTKSKLSIDFAVNLVRNSSGALNPVAEQQGVISNGVKTIFQLLVFLLPTQLAYHFWQSWAFIFGIRVDYLAPAIYLTDILIFLLFTFYFFDKISTLTALSLRPASWRGSNLVKLNSLLRLPRILRNLRIIIRSGFCAMTRKKLIVFIGLLVFIGINIFSAQSIYPALFKWLKILEFLFLGYFVAMEKKLVFSAWIAKPMSLSLILFSVIGLWQVLISHSIGGLFYFLGERTFSLSTPGIATANYLNRDWLRAYSTFSHPNSLAGFFGAGTFIILFTNFKNRFWNAVKYFSFVFGHLILVLTFSLSSYISIFLAFVLLIIAKNNKMITKPLVYLAIFLTTIVAFVLPFISLSVLNDKFLFPENISERFALAGVAVQMIRSNFLFGVGLNNFIVILSGQNLLPQITWLLQPVHNIFLLIASEMGLIGLVLFLILLIRSVNNLRKNSFLLVIIFYILLTGSTDHYWLTLQQNQLLFVIILGLSFNKKISSISRSFGLRSKLAVIARTVGTKQSKNEIASCLAARLDSAKRARRAPCSQ